MAQAAFVLPSQTPDIEIKSFELMETEDNLKSIELKSPEAKVFKKQNLIGIESPSTVLWNKNGEATLIKGDRGIVESDKGDIQIEGNTEIESPNNMIFKTTSILLDNQKKLVQTESPVEGRSKDNDKLKISGTGLTVDIKSQSYAIHSDVRAIQKSATDEFAITSKKALIYPSNSKANFSGTALVQSKKMLLKGDSAILVFNNDSKSSSIKQIEMSSESSRTFVDVKLENFVIKSRGFITIFDKSGELSESQATGEVFAVSDTGVRMYAETLILTPEKEGLVVNLEKGVKILIDERVATCDEAVYFPNTGEIILKKFASVVKKEQELHGDLIRLSTLNSEVIVEKASGTMTGNALKRKSK